MSYNEIPSQISSISSVAFCLTLPLFIGVSSTNRNQGILKGILGIICLILFPYIYTKSYAEKYTKYTGLGGLDISASFSTTFIIVMIIMFLSL